VALLSAHRGGPEGTRAPDTLDTIAAACELGVDLVEFDVRVNADGAFVIGHGGPSEVLLSSVLDLIRGRARGHVDLKVNHSEIEIADLCLDRLGPDGFVVTTRFDAGIARLRAARPDVMVGLSLGRQSPWLHRNELFPWRRLERCGANLVAAHHRLARFGVLAGAARRGLPVLVWTLNSDRLIRRAQRDERVWAYTTDYPRRALRLLRIN
jgi:glycerophosphoryl diester phosphodiesterase